MNKPTTMTKSLERTLHCETFHAAHIIGNAPQSDSALRRAGTEFHDYRRAYINHLLETDQAEDREWVEAWLRQNNAEPEVVDVIRFDAIPYDLSTVLATELFLSVDQDFQPLEHRPGSTPGERSGYASGTLDLIMQESPNVFTIPDYKSGWSTNNVHDYETVQYAALLMAHYPEAEIVEFRWEFARVRAERSRTYQRSDLPWMQAMIHAAVRQRENIVEKVERLSRLQRVAETGETELLDELGIIAKAKDAKQTAVKALAKNALTVNTESGLCNYCRVTCPARQELLSMAPLLPPIQTEDDALEVARKVAIAEAIASQGRKALNPWLAEHGGRLEMGGGYEAVREEKQSREYTVADAQSVAETFDVPLGSLKVSASQLKSYAKAKKREGMSEALDLMGRANVRTELKIRRAGEPDEAEAA